MGHEIAHALREHSREQVSEAMAAQAGIGIGGALLGLDPNSTDFVTQGYQMLVATKFSPLSFASFSTVARSVSR